MTESIEDCLDRHFVSQLTMIGKLILKSVCPFQLDLINRWLLVLNEAPSSDKFARNSLMALMIQQLSGEGKLEIPFLKLSNMQRPLEEVLTKFDREFQNQSQPNYTSKPRVVDKCEESDVVKNNTKNYADSKNRLMEKLSKEDKMKSFFKEQSEKNRLSLEQDARINFIPFHAWQNKMNQKDESGHQIRLQAVEPNSHRAIRRLKNWIPNTGPLNFLQIILRNTLDDDPETRRVLRELDDKLERELNNLLEREGDRREKNVRIIYEKLLKEQQNALLAKRVLFEQVQQFVTEARQKLEAKDQLQYHKKKPTQD